jgi:murein peptide amidase A
MPGIETVAARVGTAWVGIALIPMLLGSWLLGAAAAPDRSPWRVEVAGRSAHDRRIVMESFGDPAERTDVLVFGCIHGTECAAITVRPPRTVAVNVSMVPNLNPDGYALGTRTNGRGVDLNRNFPTAWRPIGSPGDPEHSGPRPLSEPETRLAADLIRRLEPRVTIWFHQQVGGGFVRAWGPSIPAARRYARLAEIRFVALPWMAGTAPNWQNHRFPGASSFVVELPPGGLGRAEERRHSLAVGGLARWSARARSEPGTSESRRPVLPGRSRPGNDEEESR